jgi:hypothetical protein
VLLRYSFHIEDILRPGIDRSNYVAIGFTIKDAIAKVKNRSAISRGTTVTNNLDEVNLSIPVCT